MSYASASFVFVALVVVWAATLRVLRRADFNCLTGPQRTILTVSAGTTAALLAWIVWSRPQPQPSDLAPVWAGARALAHGASPYQIVNARNPYALGYPLLYPLTAVLVLLPLSSLPLRWVDPIFVGAGFALFTWAITAGRRVPPAAVALVSLAALMTLQTSQWSLLLAGAALAPTFGALLIAKPTIGLALFAAYPRWKTAIGCASLLVVSLLVAPHWIGDWRAGFASAPHVVAPITRPGGVLLLLAALRWRRADARLLLALACVPHTTAPYETIPLFLIPATWAEAWVLWALSIGAYVAQAVSGPYASQGAYWTSGAQWIVLLMYLPCLVLVLSRPSAAADAIDRPGFQPGEAPQLSW